MVKCLRTSMFICKCFRLEKLVFSGSNTNIFLTMRIILTLCHIVVKQPGLRTMMLYLTTCSSFLALVDIEVNSMGCLLKVV